MKTILFVALISFGQLALASQVCLLGFSGAAKGGYFWPEVACSNGQTQSGERLGGFWGTSEKDSAALVAEQIEKQNRVMAQEGLQSVGTFQHGSLKTITLYVPTSEAQNRTQKYCLAWKGGRNWPFNTSGIAHYDIDCNDGVVTQLYISLSEFLKKSGLKEIAEIGIKSGPSYTATYKILQAE